MTAPLRFRAASGACLCVLAALLVLAACSSSKKSSASAPATTAGNSPSNGAASTNPATSFSTAAIAGLGTALVDGRGRTVYVLTKDDHTNVPCDDASGCTKVWPDLPFPDGVTSATAGAGITASLLGSKKLADGETYPTYNGWLLYEFANDSAAGQAHGEGIKSFGGTWYALSPAGTIIDKS